MPPRGKNKQRQSRRGETEFKNQIERVITAFVNRAAAPPRRSAAGRRTRMTLQEATRRFQLEFVRGALDEHQINGRWNISAAARALAVSRTYVYRLIEELPDTEQFEKQRTQHGRAR